MRKGLPFAVRIPNAQTITAMEAAGSNKDLEEITLKQLHQQFQTERKKSAKHKRKS